MYDSLYQVSMDLLSVATAVDANEFAFDHEKVWDAVNDVETEMDALATPVLNVANVQSRIAHLYVLKVISGSITTLSAKATAHVRPTVLFLDSLGALLRCIFLLDRILTTSVPETAVITSAYAFDHRQAGCPSAHHGALQGPAIALPTTHLCLEGLASVNQIACNLGVAFASCVHARPAVLQAAESLLGRFRTRRTRTVAQLHHIRNLPENRMPAIGAGCTTRRERVFRPTQHRIVQWSIEQKKAQASRIRATYAATLSMIDSDIEFVQTCQETFRRLPDRLPTSNSVLAMVVSSIQFCDA
ncbi:hypothetical protein PBRA_004750 [Plasmodiophora brassicae]|nr:hypothetical protein PBRA_004750 [Plasmodiophora brassicae]